LGYIYSDKYSELEIDFHRKYSNKRKSGEWFDISINTVKNEITENKGQWVYNSINDCKINDGLIIENRLLEVPEPIKIMCDSMEKNKWYANKDILLKLNEIGVSPRSFSIMLDKWAYSQNISVRRKNAKI
jgi:hypothetical protein